jgi:hypothetical protein
LSALCVCGLCELEGHGQGSEQSPRCVATAIPAAPQGTKCGAVFDSTRMAASLFPPVFARFAPRRAGARHAGRTRSVRQPALLCVRPYVMVLSRFGTSWGFQAPASGARSRLREEVHRSNKILLLRYADRVSSSRRLLPPVYRADSAQNRVSRCALCRSATQSEAFHRLRCARSQERSPNQEYVFFPGLAEQFMIRVPGEQVSTHARAHTHTHAHTHAHTHSQTHTHARTHAHAHTRTHPHPQPDTRTRRRTDTPARTQYTHTHTRARARTHTHKHTRTRSNHAAQPAGACAMLGFRSGQ